MLNYERCRISNSDSTITIGGDQVIGAGVTSFSSSSLNDAEMILPSPIQDSLTTIIGSECNTRWNLKGHTNLLIKGNEIKPGCDITANGNNTDSILTVDFGLETSTCTEGFTLEVYDGTMDINGATLVYGTVFKNIIIKMSRCDDVVRIKQTYDYTNNSLIDIFTGGGDDMIEIGDEGHGIEDRIYSNIIVEAGNGTDSLIIHDDGSPLEKDIEIRFNFIRGFDGADYRNSTDFTDVFYFGVEHVVINLGVEDQVVNIMSTAPNSTTNVTSQGGDDFINATSTAGNLNVHTAEGNDNITIHTTGDESFLYIDAGEDDDNIIITGLKGDAEVKGGEGSDKLYVDGRSLEGASNTINYTTVLWEGGDGNNTLEMFFVSLGTTNLNMTGGGDSQATNEVILHCPDIACTVLSRKTFLANIHDPDDPDTSLERLNKGASAEISSLLLFLHEGNNSMHFDDTIGSMDVFGGNNTDSFYIGQVRSRKSYFLLSIYPPLHTHVLSPQHSNILYYARCIMACAMNLMA